MIDLNELLSYLEDHIDPAHIENTEKLHIAAMDYMPIPVFPLSVVTPQEKYITHFPYSDVFQNFEKMLYNELGAIDNNVLNSVIIKDDYPLQIRANYGIGIIASLLGAEINSSKDPMPWVIPVSPDDAKKILDKGVPDPDQGLGRLVRECCEYYREKLRPYPKCAEYIHITQPDLQGPFDVLHLLLGSNVFYCLVDETETIHELLSLITETYIRYRQYIEPYINDTADNGKKSFVHFGLYGGKVIIKDDTSTAAISEEMYREFAMPYNARIYSVFGDSSLHYCGRQKPWHYKTVTAQKINCLNFGNSEMQNWSELYPVLKEKKICAVNVGEGQPYVFVQNLLDNGIVLDGMTFMVCAQSKKEAINILCRHREH